MLCILAPPEMPMTRIIFIALLALPILSAGQTKPAAKPAKPLPELTYVTPQMSKKQVDSLISVLYYHDLFLSFDTLEYDANKRIKRVNGALDTKTHYFPLITDHFKGITIISKGDSITVIMGILPKQPKK